MIVTAQMMRTFSQVSTCQCNLQFHALGQGESEVEKHLFLFLRLLCRLRLCRLSLTDSLAFFHCPVFFKRIVHLLGRIRYYLTRVLSSKEHSPHACIHTYIHTQLVIDSRAGSNYVIVIDYSKML